MNILVCISNVPDTTTKITFTADQAKINTSGIQFIINPYDEIALAKAIELAENGKGTVTVIHVGDAGSEPVIRKALAIGADTAVRIDAVPTDSFSTAKHLASWIGEQTFDLIFTGRESIDYNGNATGVMLAELLAIPAAVLVKNLSLHGTTATIEKEIEGGVEVFELTMPLVLTCSEGLAEPKIPNMRGIMSARTKALAVVPAEPLAPLTAISKLSSPPQRGSVKLLPADQVAQLVDLLHREARII